MEGESGLDSPSDLKMLTFAEFADEMCAHYMSIGMTYDEYWYGDFRKLEHYRKADELRKKRVDHDAWLLGGYVYDALCAVSPVLNAFAKRGTKPAPYHKKPYSMESGEIGNGSAEKKPSKTKEELQEIHALNASAKFASFMTHWNKRFDQKGGEVNGSDN